MDRPAANRERSFLDGFSHRGMTVAGAGYIFGGTAKLDDRYDFLNQVSSIRADNMTTEYSIGLRVRQNFDKAIRVAIAACAAVGHERKLAYPVGLPRRLQFYLELADVCNFGPRINDARNRIVVNMPGLTGQDFSDDDTFVFCLVRQHWAWNAITDGVDARHVCLKLRIDLNDTPAISLDPDRIETEPLRVGHTADGQ